MTDSAKRRVEAIGNHLAASASGLPSITQVAPESAGPRATGKVVIITGTAILTTFYPGVHRN